LFLRSIVGRPTRFDAAQPQAGQPKTDAEKLSTPVDVVLFDASTAAVWRCLTTVGELKPACIGINDYVALLAGVLGFTTSKDGSAAGACDDAVSAVGCRRDGGLRLTVHPGLSPPPTTPMVRIEAAVDAAGGHASLAVATLHCSLCGAGATVRAELLDGLVAMASERSAVAAALDKERRNIVALQAAKEASAAESARELAETLQAALRIVNTKKAKIREFADQLDAAHDRVAQLEAELETARSERAAVSAAVDAGAGATTRAESEVPPLQRGPRPERDVSQRIGTQPGGSLHSGSVPPAAAAADSDGDSDGSFVHDNADASGAAKGTTTGVITAARNSTADLLGLSL
jgi:hypothetical protein